MQKHKQEHERYTMEYYDKFESKIAGGDSYQERWTVI